MSAAAIEATGATPTSGATGIVDRAPDGARAPTRVTFVGDPHALARLMLRDVVLVVLTLGIYRFWMRTHLRQYYWNSFAVDGEPFEYTGRSLELFLGFFYAIVFLAIYILLVNLGLAAMSLAYLQSYEAALALSLASILPLAPFAKYRAQRYLLSRTRWRGLRFGLGPSAYVYMGRSLAWSLATVLTLGLAWPAADVALRRYVTERTHFGDRSFALDATAAPLFRVFVFAVWLPAVVALGASAAYLLPAVLASGGDPNDVELQYRTGVAAVIGAPVAIGLVVAWLWYGGYRLKFFLDRTRLGPTASIEGAELDCSLSPRRLLRIAIGGYAVVAALIVVAVLGSAAFVFPVLRELELPGGLLDAIDASGGVSAELVLAYAPVLGAIVLVYLLLYVLASVGAEVLVSRRIAAAVARSLTLTRFERVETARQRPEDVAMSADGFADALDVGPI